MRFPKSIVNQPLVPSRQRSDVIFSVCNMFIAKLHSPEEKKNLQLQFLHKFKPKLEYLIILSRTLVFKIGFSGFFFWMHQRKSVGKHFLSNFNGSTNMSHGDSSFNNITNNSDLNS